MILVYHDPGKSYDLRAFAEVTAFRTDEIEFIPDVRFVGRPPLVMLPGGRS